MKQIRIKGEQDSMDIVVEALSLEQIKTLAARQLRCYLSDLSDDLRLVADARRVSGEDGLTVKIGVDNYEKTKQAMKKYGIWQEEYEGLLKLARDTGEFDSDRFYQIADSFKVPPQ